jgi:hypothetical protein
MVGRQKGEAGTAVVADRHGGPRAMCRPLQLAVNPLPGRQLAPSRHDHRHPGNLVWRTTRRAGHAEGLKLLRVFAVAPPSRPAGATAQRADLQESGGTANADGVADRSLSGRRDDAETGSDQRFCVVAGVGFEPT